MCIYKHGTVYCIAQLIAKFVLKKKNYQKWKDITLNEIESQNSSGKEPSYATNEDLYNSLTWSFHLEKCCLVLHQIKMMVISV